jgi:hypothetical protein
MIVNRQKSTVAALPSTERWRHQKPIKSNHITESEEEG